MYSKDIARKTFFIPRSRAITLIIISWFYPSSNLTCILWLYTVYEIWIQYITVFKRYCPETILHMEIKGHNSDNNWWILSVIERDLYFMIIYLCMKHESNAPMYSKDIARKPFFERTGRTDKGDAICPAPPITNGGGITKPFIVSTNLLMISLFHKTFCVRYTICQ